MNDLHAPTLIDNKVHRIMLHGYLVSVYMSLIGLLYALTVPAVVTARMRELVPDLEFILGRTIPATGDTVFFTTGLDAFVRLQLIHVIFDNSN